MTRKEKEDAVYRHFESLGFEIHQGCVDNRTRGFWLTKGNDKVFITASEAREAAGIEKEGRNPRIRTAYGDYPWFALINGVNPFK